MKLFKTTLMVCSAMVLGSSVNAMEFSRVGGGGAGGGGRMLAAASSAENSFITDVDAQTAVFLQVAINGSRGSVGGKINPAQSAYTKEQQKVARMVQIDTNEVLNEIKND
jgi:hypothetical protein